MQLIQFIVGHTCDICNIFYSGGFKQRFWLEGDLFDPEYIFIQEGTEDGDSNFILNYGKTQKKYRFRFLMPEFFMDGVSLMHMHNNVSVVLPDGRTEKILSVEMSQPDWAQNSCNASAELTFITDGFNHSTGQCCEQLPLSCLSSLMDILDAGLFTDAEYTDPKDNGITQGDLWIFYNTTTKEGNVYLYDGVSWVNQNIAAGSIVTNTDTGKYWFYNGRVIVEVPKILSAARQGTEVTISGQSIPGLFIEVSWFQAGMPDYETFDILSNQFISGYTFNVPGELPTYIYVLLFSHDCDYGYSDEVNTT